MKTLHTLGLSLTLIGACAGTPTYAGDYYTLDQLTPQKEVLDILALECQLQRPTPPETFMGSDTLANGLAGYKFDTNKDGKADVQIFIPQGDENRYPLFYMFDNDYDTEPDIQWVDQKRDGTCAGVEVYWHKGQREVPRNPKGEF